MKQEHVWCIIGKSVRGASHVRSGLDNQDAICLSRPEGGDRLPLVLAVADGHGSAKHIRSKIGADLAVQVATTELTKLVASTDEHALALKIIAKEKLPAVIERSWKEAVDRDFNKKPLSEEEIAAGGVAGATEPGQATGYLERYSLYGTTLLAVAVMPQFILYLQLGDGDILTVSSAGEVARALERDERLIGNDTTSLCQANAKDQFRVRFQMCSDYPPALIVVSTDGYANSYQRDDDFLKIGPDMLNLIREEGLDALDAALEGWLDETSKNGSGDDITVGIIAHIPTLSGMEEKSETDLTGTSVGSPGNAGAAATEASTATARRCF